MDVFTAPWAFSWSELITSDPQSAAEFHGALFGWKLDAMPMPAGTYVDAIARRCAELGGKVVLDPKDIPGVGRFAVILDRQGGAEHSHLSADGLNRNGRLMTKTTGTVCLHRVIRAPAERIYRAFLDADALVKFLPPHGFACRVHELDARDGFAAGRHGRHGRQHRAAGHPRRDPARSLPSRMAGNACIADAAGRARDPGLTQGTFFLVSPS